jgi:hypothetical protein
MSVSYQVCFFFLRERELDRVDGEPQADSMSFISAQSNFRFIYSTPDFMHRIIQISKSLNPCLSLRTGNVFFDIFSCLVTLIATVAAMDHALGI